MAAAASCALKFPTLTTTCCTMHTRVTIAPQQRVCSRQGGAFAVRAAAHSPPLLLLSELKSGFLERLNGLKYFNLTIGSAALAAVIFCGGPAYARLEGVNRPELLPPGPVTPVIDVAGFLTDGEEARIRARVEALERDTGIRLRVLAQNYPETPGLAIKDYWGVNGDTVVFVADPNTGNILNFNVGENVDLQVPRSFWSRLAGRFGTKFYWRENGQDVAIVNAVAAIDNCLREPIGKLQCNAIRGELE